MFFVFFVVLRNPEEVKVSESSKRQSDLLYLREDKELMRLRCRGPPSGKRDFNLKGKERGKKQKCPILNPLRHLNIKKGRYLFK